MAILLPLVLGLSPLTPSPQEVMSLSSALCRVQLGQSLTRALSLSLKVSRRGGVVWSGLSYSVPSFLSASQSVQITSTAIVGDMYVETNQVAVFRVDSVDGSGHIIPPDTDFTWHVVPGKPLPSFDAAVVSVSPLQVPPVCSPSGGRLHAMSTV